MPQLKKGVSIRNMGTCLETESLSLGLRCFFFPQKKFSGSFPSFPTRTSVRPF